MQRSDWDARYGASELVWGTDPNRFVAEAFGDGPARWAGSGPRLR